MKVAIKLTDGQRDMLRECGWQDARRGGFDWGEVQAHCCNSANIGDGLAWHNFVRQGEALLDKGLVTTGPSEAIGKVTALGRAWLDAYYEAKP